MSRTLQLPPPTSLTPARQLWSLLRVHNLFIIVVVQVLVRIFLIGPRENWLQLLQGERLWLLCLASAVVAAAGYIINDYYDIKIDLINRPERVIIGKRISRRKALFVNVLLNFLGIGLGFWLHPLVGGLLLSMGFTLWLYSNLLKRLPLVGNLVLPVLPTTVLLSVGALYGFFSLKLLLLIVLAGFITLIRSLTKDMADMRGDKQFGLRTLPILWGIRKTKKLIFAIAAVGGLVATMALWQLKNWPLLLYFSLLLLPIGWFLYRLYYADRKAEYRKLSVLAKYIMLSGLGAVLFL